MAKKKDTLKDLNEFMKNQPSQKDGDESYLEKKPTSLAEVERLKSDLKKLDELPDGALNEDLLAGFIHKIASAQQLSPRQVLFRLCERTLDMQEESDSSDIMLLNTILYIKQNDLLVEKLK
ncbi:hypothetical protein JKA74_19005 [Marivirga sp. S37H4]|uniref:Uncharacterized protein n=1 Tax=Marivirga aurantiaca TaxID=2802615 RepID=A0A934X297_9BACT|nr:hypothetical protein [Marivirga aurantiaca]MBK6267141.1 hypothetical protein [Marivirga aurantiaca]